MRKPQASVTTRTPDFAVRRELPLATPPAPPPPIIPERGAADRIKDALLRWLEEEL